MNWGKHALETATLIVAAVICALIANALAPRDRKLVVVSQYSTPAITQPRQPDNSITSQATTTQTTTTQPANRQPDNPATTAPAVPQPQKPATAAKPPAASRQQPTTAFNPHPDRPYVEIRYPDVVALHDRGALFLDARRTSVFEEGHIAGARPFSVWESDIDQKVNNLFNERSDPRQQNEPIVVYCSGGDCEDSHMLAQKLWGIQFNNVYVYKDGFPDWQAHGGAVHPGPKP